MNIVSILNLLLAVFMFCAIYNCDNKISAASRLLEDVRSSISMFEDRISTTNAKILKFEDRIANINAKNIEEIIAETYKNGCIKNYDSEVQDILREVMEYKKRNIR